jgi:hypothetical protein
MTRSLTSEAKLVEVPRLAQLSGFDAAAPQRIGVRMRPPRSPGR